jgi:DNA-binding transcriptional MerR regulator
MPEKPSRTRPRAVSVALEGRAISPSELARLTGVSTDTLRHYERKGVLGIPARSQGGYRLYPPEAVGRVRLVRRALAIGFTLHDLAAALSERARGGTPCRSVRALVAERLAELETRLRDLAELRDSCGCSSGTGTSGSRRFLKEPRLGSLMWLADRPAVDRAVDRQQRTIGRSNPPRRLDRRH